MPRVVIGQPDDDDNDDHSGDTDLTAERMPSGPRRRWVTRAIEAGLISTGDLKDIQRSVHAFSGTSVEVENPIRTEDHL